MKKGIKNIALCIFVIATVASCGENPIEKEQYKNEVYLVGAYERTHTRELNYAKKGEMAETFISVSTSGSLNINKDVTVVLNNDTALVGSYNRKFFGITDSAKYYVMLKPDYYNVPDLKNVVIEHQKEIFKRAALFINTDHIHPDSTYAIPFRIESVSDYSVNETGQKMLLLLKMINDYSGTYDMTGTYGPADDKFPSHMRQPRTLIAVSHNTVRLFYGVEQESKDVEKINGKCITLTVLDEADAEHPGMKKVVIEAWSPKTLNITGISGRYDPAKKTFIIQYMHGDNVYKQVLKAAGNPR